MLLMARLLPLSPEGGERKRCRGASLELSSDRQNSGIFGSFPLNFCCWLAWGNRKAHVQVQLKGLTATYTQTMTLADTGIL
jgi:hypothetical protein